jgi:hypothetical protein
MNATTDTRPPEELGYLSGQRAAFAQTAGRCTAASAVALREIHDWKLYLRYARSWKAFCLPYLKTTHRHADNLIGLLNRFGPIYFGLNHLVDLTPEEFVLIESSIRHDGIEYEGRVIALNPANTAEPAEAIATLTTRHPDNIVPATPMCNRIDSLTRRLHALPDQLRRILESPATLPSERDALKREIRTLQSALSTLHP